MHVLPDYTRADVRERQPDAGTAAQNGKVEAKSGLLNREKLPDICIDFARTLNLQPRKLTKFRRGHVVVMMRVSLHVEHVSEHYTRLHSCSKVNTFTQTRNRLTRMLSAQPHRLPPAST